MSSLTDAIISNSNQESLEDSQNVTETDLSYSHGPEEVPAAINNFNDNPETNELATRLFSPYRGDFPRPISLPNSEPPIIHANSTASSPVPMRSKLDQQEEERVQNNNSNNTPGDTEEEVFQLISVQVYLHSAQHVLKINRTITGRDICRALERRLSLSREDAKFFSLMYVVTVFDPDKRNKVYCIRTILNDEIVLNVIDTLISKLMYKFSIMDPNKLKNASRWFYKDVRTAPILLEDNYNNFETIGEESSDEEDELTHSDLSYLVKSERKGYLLKRSSKDINLWKKWYCILTDHLWCIDVNNPTPKFLCIRLNGVQRSRGNNVAGEQLSNIIINSTRGTHLLRAFTILDQKKWIEDLHQRILYTTDNESINMAEVIICDEELSKNRRYQKILHDQFVQAPCVTDAICHTYYQYYHADECPPYGSFPTNPTMITETTIGTDEEIDEEALLLNASTQQSAESQAAKGLGSLDIQDYEDGDDDDDDEDNKGNGDGEEDDEDDSRIYKYLNVMDRSTQPFMIHQLHSQYHTFFNVFKFLVEVLQYRELFRIDLYTTFKAQRISALNIFVNFLLRQVVDDERKEYILIRIVDLPEKLKRHGIKSHSLRSLPATASAPSPIPSSSSSQKIKIPAPATGAGTPLSSSLAAGSSAESAGNKLSTNPKPAGSLSYSPVRPVSIANTPTNAQGQGQGQGNGSNNNALSRSPQSTPNQINANSGRFPVLNAVKTRYQLRQERWRSRWGRNGNLASSSGPSHSNSSKRHSLLKREVSFDESDFSWGVNEETIMRVFYKLFPENPLSSSRSDSPNPSNQSADELLLTRTSTFTPVKFIRSNTSNGSNNAQNSAPSSASSSWYWPWGSSNTTTTTTATANNNGSNNKATERPPTIATPSVKADTPQERNHPDTPYDPGAGSGITLDLFDEVVEEVLRVLHDKAVVF